MYITVEGVIGAGKTTLTTMIGKELGYNTCFEIVEENPLLEKFYLDQKKWAFQTEMFFLTDRYQQLKEIDNMIQKKQQKVVADYNIMKNLIFAKETLTLEDYDKFLQIFNILVKSIKEASLIIVIDSSINTLKKNIKQRDRVFERDISTTYLRHLIKAYKQYIKLLKETYQDKLLIIDGDNYDFVNNLDDYQKIIKKIKEKVGELNV